MRTVFLGMFLALVLFANAALADEKGGPYTVFSATVRVLVATTPAASDVPTLIRFDPRSGHTWVMVPPAAPGSSPYWIPVVEPLDFGSKK